MKLQGKQNGGFRRACTHIDSFTDGGRNLFQTTTIKRRANSKAQTAKPTIVESGKFNSRFAFRKFLQKWSH